jgi:hypothetical protein
VSPYTVGELASDFQRHADGYFLKNGRPTSRTYVVRAALKFLEPFSGITVERFGAADLRLIRERIVSSTIGKKEAKRHPSRITVNEYCRIIAGAFTWAANELRIAHLLAVAGCGRLPWPASPAPTTANVNVSLNTPGERVKPTPPAENSSFD